MKLFKKIIFLILSIAVLWALGFALYLASSLNMKPHDPERATDAVVVLTGGDKRVETGLELLADGKTGHLFISGVNPQVTEGEIRYLWTGAKPLPDCCITLGVHSNSTIENAAETRAWIEKMQFKSIRLVTANYHIHRAMLELSHAMPNVEIIAHPIVPSNNTMTTSYYWTVLLSEYNKILLRWVSLTIYPEN